MVNFPHYLSFVVIVIIFLCPGIFYSVFNVSVHRVYYLSLWLVRNRLEHLIGELEVEEIA